MTVTPATVPHKLQQTDISNDSRPTDNLMSEANKMVRTEKVMAVKIIAWSE